MRVEWAIACRSFTLADNDVTLEGVAVDKTGNIYVSVTPLGQIRRYAPDGSESLLATVPATAGFGPTGLAVDATGTVYAADVTFDPATRGVYRIGRDGSSERLPCSRFL